MSELEEQKPTFCAVLTPHRALSPKGIRIVIIITCLLALIPGLVFFLMGAWPVVGFLGADVALLYWALTRSHADVYGFEEITLFRDKLLWRKVSPKGVETIKEMNPFWTKLEIGKDLEDRVTNIMLTSNAQKIQIGSFLNPDDKKSFANAFSNAFYQVKR